MPGQNGNPGIRRIGMESLHSRNCSVFEQCTMTNTKEGKMLIPSLVRFHSGSNDLLEDGKRFDFWKKVKKADNAAVQKTCSVMGAKSIEL